MSTITSASKNDVLGSHCAACHSPCGPGGFCDESCYDSYRQASDITTTVLQPRAVRKLIRSRVVRVVYVRTTLGIARLTKREALALISPKLFTNVSVSRHMDSVCLAAPED